MLPFIVALIFAVGLPLLPSSLHRALHLPTLKFNFLSARHAPEQSFVSPPEPTLLLESSYSEVSPDSGGSFQPLVFPDIPGPNCWNDATTIPACTSLTEKQDYPQTSIWNTIHAQLLYRLAEATIIITLSFFAAATFLPRQCLYTLMERLCTSLYISRQYSSKAALSSFLQDVFSGLHRYWMENSVAKGQAPKSVPNTSWLAALDVFADVAPGEYCEIDVFSPSVSVSVRQDHIHRVPLDGANLCFGRSSSSISSTPLVHSAKIPPFIDSTFAPFLDVPVHSSRSEMDISGQERSQYIFGTTITRDPFHTIPPTVITEITKHTSEIPDAETFSHSGISLSCPLEAPEPSSNTSSPVSSHLRSSTGSLPSILMEDLYHSARRGAGAALLSESSRGTQEAGVSDSSTDSYSSCDHEPLRDIATDPKSERFQPESNSISSLRIFQGSHRRYKSDSIQVRVASCHLGDTAAPLAPAKVDVTCAFWKCALQNDEGSPGTVAKEASGSGSFTGSWAAPHIKENRPELANVSPTSADAAVTGIVITPEGTLVVPASQRSDGRYFVRFYLYDFCYSYSRRSTRREIRVRPGHVLREPLAEKYRPPAARRRTLTWDPYLREHMGSPSSSPHLHSLSLTPKGTRQQLFVRHNNSPASLSDNWRWSSSGPIVEGTPPTTVLTQPLVEALPVVVEAPERKSPSKTSRSSSCISPTMVDQASLPVSNLATSFQQADRLLSHFAALGLSPTKDATENIKKVVEATQADRQPEEHWSTHSALADAKLAGRRPLQDITAAISVPGLKAIEYQAHPLPATTAGPIPVTSKQVTDVFLREVLIMPIPISEIKARETTPPTSPHNGKPSAEHNTIYATNVLRLSGIPIPHHPRPRARRSAPHLGQYVNNSTKQQTKAIPAVQTPDGSKRRRTRTASARGVENWNFNWATPTVDRTGQIILPAGTGWKGRSSVGPAGQQQQRQRQPTAVVV